MTKMKPLIVDYGVTGYCHNLKCNFYNVFIGSEGLKEGIKFKCCVCGKPMYAKDDGSGEMGDCDIDI